jgi:hypothetical protein
LEDPLGPPGVGLAPGGGAPQPPCKPTPSGERPWPDQCARPAMRAKGGKCDRRAGHGLSGSGDKRAVQKGPAEAGLQVCHALAAE